MTSCPAGQECNQGLAAISEHISKNKLTALIAHYKEHGLTPRRKKTGGRKCNTKILSYDDIRGVVTFITNYADEHALLLPGRVPGYKRSDIRLLPSSETKASVWRKYGAAMAILGLRAARLSTFRKLWRQLLPHIVQTRPMTDLCWECQKNNESVYRSANLPDDIKCEKVRTQEQHLHVVQLERSLYNKMVHDAKLTAECIPVSSLGPNNSVSRDIQMHYSFDYAQQVHIPSNPMQPGPMYFLVPRKCGIFGVCCEALPQQVNYLIDEGMCCSKGSNSVISYIHHFFEHWGLGERDVHLHCDNCSGQNKNKYMLWYLAWRVMTGLHASVTMNFMVAGHTKFAPDWCFGLLKQCFRRTSVSCLQDLCSVVTTSTVTGVNKHQLVGSESGTVYVKTFDWQAFLEPKFRPLPGIKKLHHFRFSSQTPGTVFFNVEPNDEEQSFLLLNDRRVDVGLMPTEIPPPGLPLQRQQYLFDKIREFVRDDAREVVCPQPCVRSTSDSTVEMVPHVSQVPPPLEKSRKSKRTKNTPSRDSDVGRGRGKRGRKS